MPPVTGKKQTRCHGYVLCRKSPKRIMFDLREIDNGGENVIPSTRRPSNCTHQQSNLIDPSSPNPFACFVAIPITKPQKKTKTNDKD